jgi:hypothetical protein
LRICFTFSVTGGVVGGIEQVDDVVVALAELRLDEVAQELRVAAVAVDDDDLVEAVAARSRPSWPAAGRGTMVGGSANVPAAGGPR